MVRLFANQHFVTNVDSGVVPAAFVPGNEWLFWFNRQVAMPPKQNLVESCTSFHFDKNFIQAIFNVFTFFLQEFSLKFVTIASITLNRQFYVVHEWTFNFLAGLLQSIESGEDFL